MFLCSIKNIVQKKRAAETLVEVIIAIFVVAIGSSVATSLIVTAFQSNSFSRDNLIALNLAEEGLEAMRSIRDTNWLKYAFDKDTCWNVMPEVPDCTQNSPIITPGSYVVELDQNYLWKLRAIANDLNLEQASPGNDAYRLKIVDRDGNHFYSPDVLMSPYQEIFTDPQNGRFYRMVQITNVDTSTGPATSMNIRSTVQWISQGKAHSISLDSILTNYQKVKK